MSPVSSASSSAKPVSVEVLNISRDRPSEAEYGWAQDSYNATQRTLDTWWARGRGLRAEVGTAGSWAGDGTAGCRQRRAHLGSRHPG
jgi:hypothetical protein